MMVYILFDEPMKSMKPMRNDFLFK